VVFDLVVDKKIFVRGLGSLEEAISSFLHVCFVAHLSYPKGAGMLCTFIQRWIAKLDEKGTIAKQTRKDQTAKEDKAACKAFDKIFADYAAKVFMLSQQ
jgi:hypothetical protein